MADRNMVLAWRARRAGAKHSLRIIWEARAAGIPVSLAFALVEQESGFRNVFGHDLGGLFPGQPVTRRRVKALLEHVRAGGGSNGVGLTQLTYPPFIRQAEACGGAHCPKYQLRVGFGVMRNLLREHDRKRDAYAAYNGTGRAAELYAAQLRDRQEKWHKILTKGDRG